MLPRFNLDDEDIYDPDEYVLMRLDNLIKDEDDAALMYLKIGEAYAKRGRAGDHAIARMFFLMSRQESFHKRFLESYRRRRI